MNIGSFSLLFAFTTNYNSASNKSPFFWKHFLVLFPKFKQTRCSVSGVTLRTSFSMIIFASSMVAGFFLPLYFPDNKQTKKIQGVQIWTSDKPTSLATTAGNVIWKLLIQKLKSSLGTMRWSPILGVKILFHLWVR